MTDRQHSVVVHVREAYKSYVIGSKWERLHAIERRTRTQIVPAPRGQSYFTVWGDPNDCALAQKEIEQCARIASGYVSGGVFISDTVRKRLETDSVRRDLERALDGKCQWDVNGNLLTLQAKSRPELVGAQDEFARVMGHATWRRFVEACTGRRSRSRSPTPRERKRSRTRSRSPPQRALPPPPVVTDSLEAVMARFTQATQGDVCVMLQALLISYHGNVAAERSVEMETCVSE